jgi:hypothetical protein
LHIAGTVSRKCWQEFSLGGVIVACTPAGKAVQAQLEKKPFRSKVFGLQTEMDSKPLHPHTKLTEKRKGKTP